MNPWRIEHSHGDAGAFHAQQLGPDRSATFVGVDRPTLVLGSAQREAAVDARVAHALGVEVVRRRSGGGAVFLVPDEFVWLDLVIPADDPLWSDDVGHAMVWVGDLWHSALAALGLADGSSVHRGGLVNRQWSRAVCFAGTGTGEVTHGAAKVVGISQRRTRHFARFQSLCHLTWRPERIAALVAAPRPRPEDLAPVTACVDAPAAKIIAALTAALATR